MPVGAAKVGLFGGAAGYEINLLVVGGGGSGGGAYSGGGGAGGLVYISDYEVKNGVIYDITIGDGGAGVCCESVQGNTGGDTVFNVNAEGAGNTITGKGGGGGAGSSTGSAGGSGGGGAGNSPARTSPGAATQGSQPGDSGTYGFGYAGGTGYRSPYYTGGGGGGAGAVGTPANAKANGGTGKDYSPVYGTGFGASGWFAGGGGGGEHTGYSGQRGDGGSGGGGDGSDSTTPSQAGQDGAGGGSGGGGYSGGYGSSSDAGCGTVLIKRLTADSTTASGGTTSTSGDYTYHLFMVVGSATFTA